MNEILLIIAIVITVVYYTFKFFYPTEHTKPPKNFEPIDTDFTNYLQPKCNYITWEDKQEYLQSKEWHSKRQQILARDNFQCTQCYNKTKLEVHHITYDNWRNENLEDLTTLCRNCHQLIHDITGYSHNKTH